MRTLKKTLALILVVAMVLSFGVIGAAADFTDVTSTTEYKEAIDVMSAIGVINGMTETTFEPDGSLTRAQAAKIIAYMLLGPTNAENMSTTTYQRFTDVPTSHWAAGYIEYCANLDIIGGLGDGTFAPEGSLSSAAFIKMLLCALGYRTDVETFFGDSWAINVATVAFTAGVYDNSIPVTATSTLTRGQAMQLAFKAMTTTMVQYTGGTSMEVNGITITTGATRTNVPNATSNYKGGTSDNLMQFCERYFPKLQLTSVSNDAFGRPAHQWKNNRTVVGTYADEAAAVFTAKTRASDVASELSGYYMNNGTNDVRINNSTNYSFSTNALIKANGSDVAFAPNNETLASAIAKLTANGKLVEVYADKDTDVVTGIVTVTYTVGEVTNVTSNKTRTTYNIKPVNGTSTAYYDNVDSDDTIIIDGSIAKGDIVTYAVVGGTAYVYPTTSFSGSQTSYSSANSTIVVNGSTYTVGTGVRDEGTATATPENLVAVTDFTNDSRTNVYYLDQYGYAVATTAAAAYSDYAFIVAASGTPGTGVDAAPSIEVRAVLSDGTVGVYNVALTRSSGKYYVYGGTEVTGSNVSTIAQGLVTSKTFGYSLSGSNITLQNVEDLSSSNMVANHSYDVTVTSGFNRGVTSIGSVQTNHTVLINNATTYVVYNSNSRTANVYTGSNGLPRNSTALDGTAVVTASGNTLAVANVVFITSTTLAATADDYVYIDTTKYSVQRNANGSNDYIYDAILPDGNTLALNAGASALTASGVYSYNTDNTLAAANLVCNTSGQDYNGSTAADQYKYNAKFEVTNNLIKVGNAYYNLTDNTQVVYVNSDLSEVNDNGGYVVLEVNNGTVTTNVATIYITVD